ncbi:MAG TPA: SapC family protein [Albitalea sp.]|uniref:SapC family protein n=1 Tax=Piscinibacter sp. TaxID=1903157 RepID=UPI002ED22828
MIKSALYREPRPLDPATDRHKKVKPLADWSIAREMHAVFLAATEFPDASLALPIIFVHTGERGPEGQLLIAPVALMGLSVNENLFVDDEGRWDARYLPAFIRRYPFLTAGVQGGDSPVVFVDAAWSGFNDTEGEPLFEDGDRPAPALQRTLDFLRQFDAEQQRTRAFCARLIGLDLLKQVAADATLPGGESLKVEGILSVDEDKLQALPDATVLELHRSGMLMLLQVHLVSLRHLPELVERKAARMTRTA